MKILLFPANNISFPRKSSMLFARQEFLNQNTRGRTGSRMRICYAPDRWESAIREVLWIFPGVIAPSSSTLCCITLMILIRRNTIRAPSRSSHAATKPTPPTIVVACTCALFREHARIHTYTRARARSLCSTFIRQQKRTIPY